MYTNIKKVAINLFNWIITDVRNIPKQRKYVFVEFGGGGVGGGQTIFFHQIVKLWIIRKFLNWIFTKCPEYSRSGEIHFWGIGGFKITFFFRYSENWLKRNIWAKFGLCVRNIPNVGQLSDRGFWGIAQKKGWGKMLFLLNPETKSQGRTFEILITWIGQLFKEIQQKEVFFVRISPGWRYIFSQNYPPQNFFELCF